MLRYVSFVKIVASVPGFCRVHELYNHSFDPTLVSSGSDVPGSVGVSKSTTHCSPPKIPCAPLHLTLKAIPLDSFG